jgi:hypothetical protein
MTTTADIYAIDEPLTGATVDAPPELLRELGRVQDVVVEAIVAFKTTLGGSAPMTATRRAELMRELATLSGDPDALDRDSEVDIWGFHNGS